ncbi:hypothetical protein CKO27_00700 [Thiocystis violacea]|nr:hypothetical protein [Thiocystis violacea]
MASNASDVLSMLSYLDFERLGGRRGADYGIYLVLNEVADALDDVSRRHDDPCPAAETTTD